MKYYLIEISPSTKIMGYYVVGHSWSWNRFVETDMDEIKEMGAPAFDTKEQAEEHKSKFSPRYQKHIFVVDEDYMKMIIAENKVRKQ